MCEKVKNETFKHFSHTMLFPLLQLYGTLIHHFNVKIIHSPH